MLSSIVWIASACNTRIEGCLDPDAFNFDLSAERDCSGCCTYPLLTISLSQKWDTLNFNTADTLMDIHQQPYQITDLKYFLSSWTWMDQNGQVYTVDSSDLACGDQTLTYTNDIILIDARQFTYTLGTIRHSPAIDTIRVSVGLTEDFSCIDENDPEVPASITSNSPLWNPQTGELQAIRLIVKRNLEEEVFDTVYVKTLLQTGLYFPFDFGRGLNTQWRISVNYAKWFAGVDKNDLQSFTNSLLSGIEGSISQTP